MHMRYQARWNGTVIADSDQTVEVEGNQYFPIASVVASSLQPSDAASMIKDRVAFWHGVKVEPAA